MARPEAAGPPVPVVVMARAPDAEPARPQLAELLGAERYVRTEQILLARALAWAAALTPRCVHVAYEPTGDEASVRAAVGAGPALFAQEGDGETRRVAAAAGRVAATGGGPVLVAWPELAEWRPEHAASALGDLRAGCDVSVGPVFGGGLYLLALRGFVPTLFDLPDDTWRSSQAMARLLTAAHAAGLEAGLLRAERGLRTGADVRAALADPLLDAELRRLLEAAR